MPREERSIGQGELQVLGDEDRVELFTIIVGASRDHRSGHHRGRVQTRQVAKHHVFVAGDRCSDLFDCDDALVELDETNDMS